MVKETPIFLREVKTYGETTQTMMKSEAKHWISEVFLHLFQQPSGYNLEENPCFLNQVSVLCTHPAHQFYWEWGKKHYLPTVTAVLGKEQIVLEEVSEEGGV